MGPLSSCFGQGFFFLSLKSRRVWFFPFSSGLFSTFSSWFCSFFRCFVWLFRACRLDDFRARGIWLNYCGSLSVIRRDLLLFVLIFDESDSFILATICPSCFHKLLNDLQVVDLLVHATSLKELVPADCALFILPFTQTENLAINFLVGGKHSNKIPYYW